MEPTILYIHISVCPTTGYTLYPECNHHIPISNGNLGDMFHFHTTHLFLSKKTPFPLPNQSIPIIPSRVDGSKPTENNLFLELISTAPSYSSVHHHHNFASQSHQLSMSKWREICDANYAGGLKLCLSARQKLECHTVMSSKAEKPVFAW